MGNTMLMQVVLDTSVLIAGLKSNRGASHRILQWVGTGRFHLHLSVPVALEYEEVMRRMAPELGITDTEIGDILDYFCSVATCHEIDFLWRPFLRDPDDDMLLELAVQSDSQYIVTHNARDFEGCRLFGISTLSPRIMLQKIGV